jgi:hypothetical protein
MNAEPVAPAQADGPVLGSVISSDSPPERKRRKRPDNPPEQPTGTTRKSPTGGGSNLPAVTGVSWESKPGGIVEAWHCPPGARHRSNRKYLGRAGKRQLEKWKGLDADARQKAVEGWIAMQREKKGIQ